jgi:hypothetical protein
MSIPRPLTRVALVPVLVAGLGLAACGGGDELAAGPILDGAPQASTSTVAASWSDPARAACGLVTDDQAAALLGEVVAPGYPESVLDGSACFWSAPGFGDSSLRLIVTTNEDAYDESFGDHPQDISPVFGSLGYLVEEDSEIRVGWLVGDGSVVLIQHAGQGSSDAVLDVATTLAEALGGAS